MKWFNLGIPSIRTMSCRHGLAQFLFACGALLLTTEVRAGSLAPPAGAVVSTMKKLDEVEPRTIINATNTPGDAGGSPSLFKISAPGSYYLTGNITGVAAKYGIEIVTSDVTVDLNGFELLGVAGSLDGIGVTVSGLTNIAVFNGTVRSWGWSGVNLVGFGSANCRVESVLASGNTQGGIQVGDESTIINCSANGSTAGHGLAATKGSVITNSTARGNFGDGIIGTDGCALSNCSASNNGPFGIYVTNGSTVSHCSASGNTGTGIGAHSGSTVVNCSSNANGGRGILTDTDCTIADCTVRLNTLDGIMCGSGSVIRGNNCAGNGNLAGSGAGIHAIGSDNRIEGNNCTSGDRGIDVDTGGNFITRNTCSNNTTNWDIAAGNVILVVNATTTGAFSGNSGGAAPGSTDPNANFTY